MLGFDVINSWNNNHFRECVIVEPMIRMSNRTLFSVNNDLTGRQSFKFDFVLISRNNAYQGCHSISIVIFLSLMKYIFKNNSVETLTSMISMT